MSTFGNTLALKEDDIQECRICLQTLKGSSKLYSLFEAWDPPWEGMEPTIVEDLNRLTNIEVTKTDVLSKIICESCYDRLHCACFFVKLVQKNDQILKQSVHIEIDIPNKTGWPQPIRLDKNINSDIYDSKMEVEVKQEVISEEEDVGADATSLDMGLDSVEVKVEPEEITPQNPVSNKKPRSSRKTRLWPSAPRMKRNRRRKENKSIHRSSNDKITLGGRQTVEELTTASGESSEPPTRFFLNEAEIHDDPLLVIRGISTGTFRPDAYSITNGSNGYLYEEHLDLVKEEVCSEDEADLASWDLPLDCLLCTKCFNSISGLKAHVIAQHSYKTVKRRANGGVSPTKRPRLDRHVCATCRRAFATSTDLMVHETCHNLVVCYICKMNFDSFEQLTKHRLGCSLTKNKDATRLKTLDDVKRVLPAPIKTLSGKETTLSCPFCPEQFSDVYYLSIHQEIHHSTPNNELNDASNSELLANQNELSHAVNKVLERVSESLGMEDEIIKASSGSELLTNQIEPSETVNRVLERMRKSLGIVDDSVEASSNRLSEEVANENVPSDVLNSVLVTGSLEIEDSISKELPNQNEPSDIVGRVQEQMGESLEIEKETDGDFSSLVQNEPSVNVNSVLEKVSTTEEERMKDPNSDQRESKNELSDNVNRVLERVGASSEKEKEKIEESSNNQVSDKNDNSDSENRVLKRVSESLAMEEETSANKVYGEVNETESAKSVNSFLGSVHDGTKSDNIELDTVNDIMEIEMETTECRNIIIDNMFTTSASLLGLSATEKSANMNLDEDTEVNKLLDSVNVASDHFGNEAVQSGEEFPSRSDAFEYSSDRLSENQVRGMEIDNMETLNETLESEVVNTDKEGLEHENASSGNVIEN